MDLPNFLEAIKILDSIDPSKLPMFQAEIKTALGSYATDYGKLTHALYKLSETIMRIKDIKNEHVHHYEDMICQVIRIAIKNDFKVGYDALRCVFNPGAEFYKTANLDQQLNFPIGKDRPLKQYNPQVGEECDTVRPYVTSTSFCGWTRCIVLEAENNKYTVKYLNSQAPLATRQKRWFAPLGSRMKDYDWRMNLEIGAPVQACVNRMWFKSTIAEVGQQNGCKKVRVTYRRFAEDGDRQDSQGNKFFGMGTSEDEWMDVLSPRIQQCGKMANIKLCYYTISSQQILPDDFYDTLFEQEYKQKPFYAIMRVIFCKSLSLIKFINVFVQNGGIEKVIQIMDNPETYDDVVFCSLANIGSMITYLPRMYVKQSPLQKLYGKIYTYFLSSAKILNPVKIDMAYFCYDMIGRRIFSLTEIYRDQNQLRKDLIRQFLKMNMEKQMLAIRYLNDLAYPKKSMSEEEREAFHKFIKDEGIFTQIFHQNTHEQIIQRTVSLLQYLIERQVITLKEFEHLWTVIPASDIRGRATIEKLLAEISKKLPMKFIDFLINKILSLKPTELTVDNLNLLRQVKNREIGNQHQLRILSFLWDILTVKSANVKNNIEEQVEKVFKAFVSTIKDKKIRMNVLDSMSQKLQQCKKIKNQIQLLKDFIMSYPQTKPQQTEMVQQNSENVPETIFDAINFLKQKNIYKSLLNLLFKSKDESTKKDILQFFTFLFEYDNGDINQIIKSIYEKLGPSVNFLEWTHKLLNRSVQFTTELFEKTTDFTNFQNIPIQGFQAIQGIIIDLNEKYKNIKIHTTYEYKQDKNSNSVGTGPVTGDAGKDDKKQNKFIGPLLPDAKKHIFVLVSPSKLVGMKFLQHLLQVIKPANVYNAIIKLIIQFISNLDQTIESKAEEFRRQFLEDIVKQIRVIIQEDNYDQKVKSKLQVYINLLSQIFGETEKNGLGNLEPHFEKIQGQRLTLVIDNGFDKEKNKDKNRPPMPKFNIVSNQNFTLWRFKRLLGEIIQEKPQNIDVIKYVDPINDTYNGKSLSELLFYDKQSIKIARKSPKPIPKSNLMNEDGSDVSDKFRKVIKFLFQQYKNPEIDGLGMKQMQLLSKEKWKSSLFLQKDRLEKMFEEHDKEKKGYLTFDQFKQFFYLKSAKNENAVWRLINLAGFKNNFSPSKGDDAEINTVRIQALPRKILSNPEVYHLIFSILSNEKFKQVHLNFYMLLSLFEVDESINKEIESKIYQTIAKQQSIYTLCYAIEVANSQLAKRSQFYLDFWKNNGVEAIQNRIKQFLGDNKSIYELDALIKGSIFPGFIKILNMYTSQLLWQYKMVRFIAQNRINYMQLEDFVKKVSEIKQPQVDPAYISKTCEKLLQFGPIEQRLKQLFNTGSLVFKNLIEKYLNEKTDYLPKLTAQVVRLIGQLTASPPSYHNFQPLQFTYGVRTGSLNLRRSTVIIIYIYLFYSAQKNTDNIQQVLNKLLEQMPNQNRVQNFNYFSLLNQIIGRYLEINKDTNQKDNFFISLGNKLFDKLFHQVQGEVRNSLISDKIIMGILSILETLVTKDSVCRALSSRKVEMTEKCLFSYDIQQQLKELKVTEEMLNNQKQAQHFKNYVLCKTEDSRIAACNIIARMHEINPSSQGQRDFINTYILPIVKSIKPEVRITSQRCFEVGLKNYGSTCYMNSMLQVLNTVKPFRNSLMKCQSQAPIVNQMKNLFAALFFSERMDYAPEKLLTAFVPPINPGIQQDTTQFLNFLFDQLQASLSTTNYKKLLDEIFKGANTVQMICHSCGYKKENREQFFSFGVEIQGKFDLHSALEGSYQGEVISDYLCDECKNRGETTKRNILSQIPSIMFIHLRRIVFNYDMFVNMKIHTRLQFPEELNIEPYTKEGVQLRESLGLEYMKGLAHNEEEQKKFEQMAEHGKQKDFYKLRLKGVIVHSGSADVGHYYSILPYQKTWRKYDDSRVGIFTNSGFESECYGGSFTAQEWGSGSSINAYVLVYEKVVKNPLKITSQVEGVAKQTLIPYDEVAVYNSAEEYRKLWMDNHNFMVETHLLQGKYGKSFINFACKLIEKSPQSCNKIQLVSELIYRISYHSGIVGDLQNLLINNAQQVTPNILYEYILKDKARTFKLLFSQQRAVRDFMAKYLQIVLLQSLYKGDNKVEQDVYAYITQLLNAMTGEVAKNWLRVDGYFKLLYLLVCSSANIPKLWKLFMNRHMISTLIDYVMEKQSPVRINPKNYSLGTKTTPMDFTWGISIISFLLKYSYGLTGQNYEVPVYPEQMLYHLNDNDVTCLSFMQFYRKILRERQNLMDFSTVIQRLCIMNLQFSRAVIEIILETISSITDSKDQMTDLSHLCLQVLKIRDEFWVNRAEMLLGICVPYVMNNNLMTTFDEQRYVFTSTIYDIFPVECLFSYVYLYRLKNTLGCFQLLKAIIQGCSVSDIAIKFLARQPSPSYYFNNLIEWIEYFLNKFTNFVTLEPKHKERIQLQIENVNKYVEDVKAYMKNHPEGDYYKSVITGLISNKKEIQSIEKEGIQIKLYEYQVFCSKSQPTNQGNLVMAPYLDSTKFSRNATENSNILKFFKKPGKTIALKLEPVQQDQDKQLIGLFDQDPNPSQTKSVQTQMKEQAKEDSSKTKPIIKKAQQVKQNVEIIQQQINLQGTFVTNYFRQLEVVNKSKDKKVVKLTFDTDQNPNFIIPKQFVWKVFSKNNESLWMAKQDVDRDWGNLKMQSLIVEYEKQKHEKKNITSWWFKTYGEEKESQQNKIQAQQKAQQKVNQGPEPEHQVDQMNNGSGDGAGQGDSDFVPCPVCTLYNPSTNAFCEVCGSDLR